MAKVITGFVFSGRSFGKSKYDWSSWLDGSQWQLDPADVGGAFPKHFKHQAHLAAKKRGLSVRVEKANGGYVIQAIKDGEDAQAALLGREMGLMLEVLWK